MNGAASAYFDRRLDYWTEQVRHAITNAEAARLAEQGGQELDNIRHDYGISAYPGILFPNGAYGVPAPARATQSNTTTMATDNFSVYTIFHSSFSEQTFFQEEFPWHYLKDFSFKYIEDRLPKRPELIITFPEPMYAGSEVGPERVILHTRCERDDRQMGGGIQKGTYASFSASKQEPQLMLNGEYILPGPLNENVEFTYEGEKYTYPRWVVEMGTLTPADKIGEGNVIITTAEGIRVIGDFNLDDNKIGMNSPLLWWLSPNAITQKFLASYGKRQATTRLKSLFGNAARSNEQEAAIQVETALRDYTAANRRLELAKEGVDSYLDTMFAELERTVKEDPQVTAVWIDANAKVWAIVGSIITQNKINYGHFILNISDRTAWPITMRFDSYIHANISTSSNHSFCMGSSGSDDYHRLIGQGKFSGAIPYFIYRLSNPGGNGYRTHNPHFVPSFYPDAYKRLLQELQRGIKSSIWHFERSDDEIATMFRNDEEAIGKVTKARKAAIPYLDELTTIDIGQVWNRIEEAGIDTNESETETDAEAVELALDNNLLENVFRINDGWSNDNILWERERSTYKIRRRTSPPPPLQVGRSTASSTTTTSSLNQGGIYIA